MRRADKSYHLNAPIVLKSGSINLLETTGPVQACNGIALPFTSITKSSRRPGRGADKPYHLNVRTVFNSGSLNLLEPTGPVPACNWIALPFTSITKSSRRPGRGAIQGPSWPIKKVKTYLPSLQNSCDAFHIKILYTFFTSHQFVT